MNLISTNQNKLPFMGGRSATWSGRYEFSYSIHLSVPDLPHMSSEYDSYCTNLILPFMGGLSARYDMSSQSMNYKYLQIPYWRTHICQIRWQICTPHRIADSSEYESYVAVIDSYCENSYLADQVADLPPKLTIFMGGISATWSARYE